MIQGNAPSFVFGGNPVKLSFTVDGVEYHKNNGNVASNGNVEIDENFKLSDFQITPFSLSTFNVATNYFDSDGDAADPTTPFTVELEHKWSNAWGMEITDENQKIGTIGGPVILIIKLIPYVHSQYGIPKDGGGYFLVEQTYTIIPSSEIRYAKPNFMNVHPDKIWVSLALNQWQDGNSTVNSTRVPQRGGGYTADFDPKNGFKATASTKFPTTGFPKAKFQLIMLRDPNNYTFTSDSTAVTVDQNGFVTLESKPSGDVTITAALKNTTKTYKYKFNPTTIWVVPKPGIKTQAEAIAECGVNLPSSAHLTNGRRTNYNYRWVHSYITVSIGESVFAEWGITNKYSYSSPWDLEPSYPGSNWYTGWYWTTDTIPGGTLPVLVLSANGYLITIPHDTAAGDTHAACLG
ncbi:hypothetical protein RCS94_05375 [Orbaceae bacterium ac157xtp]